MTKTTDLISRINAASASGPNFTNSPLQIQTTARMWQALQQRQQTQYYPEPWSLDDELTEMPDALVEKLEGWKAVYVDPEQVDFCSLWALSNTQAQWFNRTSEIMAGSVFWFAAPADAVYAKLQFGGAS